jgi:hypothetical protein
MKEEQINALLTLNKSILNIIKTMSSDVILCDEATKKKIMEDVLVLKEMSDTIEENIDKFSREDAMWIERCLGRLDTLLAIFARSVEDVWKKDRN